MEIIYIVIKSGRVPKVLVLSREAVEILVYSHYINNFNYFLQVYLDYHVSICGLAEGSQQLGMTTQLFHAPEKL